MQCFRFLQFIVCNLYPDPLTACKDLFVIGDVLTWGSLTDSPSVFIKSDRIIIQGWPFFSIASKRFQEIIYPNSYMKLYLDEHPTYLKRGNLFSPFQCLKLPIEKSCYGRTHFLLKPFKGQQLIIETEGYLFIFVKRKKIVSKMYKELQRWKNNQALNAKINSCELGFRKIEEENY